MFKDYADFAAATCKPFDIYCPVQFFFHDLVLTDFPIKLIQTWYFISSGCNSSG